MRSSKVSKPPIIKKEGLYFKTIFEVIDHINKFNKTIAYNIKLENSLAGFGECVMKIVSKNTSSTICYINAKNQIHFVKPVSTAVVLEILDIIKEKDSMLSNNPI